MNKQEIIDAYLFLREHNQSIPSETLDFIKGAALNELEKIKDNSCKFCKNDGNQMIFPSACTGCGADSELLCFQLKEKLESVTESRDNLNKFVENDKVTIEKLRAKIKDPDCLSRRNHLLACIGEEAGEIQQAVGKSLRFGLFDTNPATNQTNWLELKGEIHDLIGVYQLFCDEIDRINELDNGLISKKRAKVVKMMVYAIDQGALSG